MKGLINLNDKLKKYVDTLLARYPKLAACQDDIIRAFNTLEFCYEHDGKLLIAVSDGNITDSEHIVGEMMKWSKAPRPITFDFAKRLCEIDKIRGSQLAESLKHGLMAIPLVAHEALSTAYINNVNGYDVFAQQLLDFSRPGDVFLGISTSGNSQNILNAVVAAKALDIKVIGLTGADGGELAKTADVAVKVPETEAHIIQEQYLSIYRNWCLMLEDPSLGVKEKAPQKSIEYGDFILMGDKMTGSGSLVNDPISSIVDSQRVKFLDYLKWLMTDNFRPLEDALKEKFELKHLPKRSNEEILEGIICNPNKETENKTADSNYYICNAHFILYVVRHIFTEDFYTALVAANQDKNTQFLVRNYESILRNILLDAEDLGSLYEQKIKGMNTHRSFIRTRFVPTASMHQVLRQGLYGSVSFHSFVDKEVSATIGEIRELIEFRIRRSFGIMSYVDEEGTIVPLDLSELLEIIRKYKQQIEFPIKFENIVRLYKWANGFVHSGLGDYNWIPYYIELMLRDFSFGHKKDYGWNINNGISTTEDVINDIYVDVLRARNDNLKDVEDVSTVPAEQIKYKVWSCKPECEIKSIESGLLMT